MAHDIGSSETAIAADQASQTALENARMEPSIGAGEAYKYNPEYHRMSSFLGLDDIDRMDGDVAQKVAFLRDFTGKENETDAMVELKKIKKELGVQEQGKTLIKTLYQYARLVQDRKQIDKEISLFKG